MVFNIARVVILILGYLIAVENIATFRAPQGTRISQAISKQPSRESSRKISILTYESKNIRLYRVNKFLSLARPCIFWRGMRTDRCPLEPYFFKNCDSGFLHSNPPSSLATQRNNNDHGQSPCMASINAACSIKVPTGLDVSWETSSPMRKVGGLSSGSAAVTALFLLDVSIGTK